MSGLEILTTSQASKLQLDYPDFYFSDAYGLASEASDNASWRIALWDGGAICFPFLQREIVGHDGCYDVTSPYGYPGVYGTEGVSEKDWLAFRGACKAYYREAGIVSEFLRLSGLVPGRDSLLECDPSIESRVHNQTLAIATCEGYETCWNRFDSRARTKVRKARKNGVEGRWYQATPQDVASDSIFRRLYVETMDRIEASPYYYFPDAYFDAIARHLDLYILEITKENEVIASAMMLPCGEICHLHLVGTALGANRLGVSNFLYDESCRWAAERSYRCLHIGGGLKPDDSLFYFKRGFGGDAVQFTIGQSVVDPAFYSRLVKQRAAELAVATESLFESGYFPAYRAPMPSVSEASE
ncbi:Acetyltransferase (GNAT) domain-containing protein [Neorhodopirellula lusitana]|uniref:Acetyltransferase (GNAT) domain-containing protein n=1 Tax=Neorhodopirellula lusitana TaxID=445327 RepID=A0ABY1PZH3_9BACT|nr:GNAT family N-acetyltransferase [Neorhodopirellula lusitana]SMP51679.1 Acetyltransferase (GNAT) domain-containing protein [Neorhodopirellula lusitana]